jgi:hypothetical protein
LHCTNSILGNKYDNSRYFCCVATKMDNFSYYDKLSLNYLRIFGAP